MPHDLPKPGAQPYRYQEQLEVRDLYPAHGHSFGAWSVILHARFVIIRDDVDEATFDHIRMDVIEPRLNRHGEPHQAFTRCWLLDHAGRWARRAASGDEAWEREDAAERLAAAREMWRRYATCKESEVA